MIRRSIDDGELAFYHCYNPNRAGFSELVHVAGARWPIEECFGSAKNEIGLDNYQVRTWNAWHRHITLAMLAHTFLAVTAHKAKKKDANTPNRRTGQTTRPANRPNRKPSHPSTND
jgi:SRSO17 transposase